MSQFDIIITLALAVVLLPFRFAGHRELTQMQRATDDYIQCETLARQLQRAGRLSGGAGADVPQLASGSTWTTTFEELNTTRRRETTLEYFAENRLATPMLYPSEICHVQPRVSELYRPLCHAFDGTGHATDTAPTGRPRYRRSRCMTADLTMSDADKMRQGPTVGQQTASTRDMREDVTNNISRVWRH